MEKIRLNLSKKCFLRFRYFSEIILKRLIKPMFSMLTLCLEIRRFSSLSERVNFWFLNLFFGISEFSWNFLIPWNPVSARILIFWLIGRLESLKSLKSWHFPKVKLVQITVPGFLSATIWFLSDYRSERAIFT